MMVLALLVAKPAMAGDWPIFKEVPQSELDGISRSLDIHCQIGAESLAEQWTSLARFPYPTTGEIVELLPPVEEVEAKLFELCREGAAISALSYGAAVNRARRNN
jgi:hypothetical protein